MEAGNAPVFICKCFCFLSFRVQGAQTSATLRVDITEVLSLILNMDYQFCGHFGSQGSRQIFFFNFAKVFFFWGEFLKTFQRQNK